MYKEPEFNAKAFTCPYCQTYSQGALEGIEKRDK